MICHRKDHQSCTKIRKDRVFAMQDAENRQLNFISANFSIFSRFSMMHKSNFNSLHLHMKIASIKTLKCWMSCQFFESIYCIRINFSSSTNRTVLVVCVVLWFSFTSTSYTHTNPRTHPSMSSPVSGTIKSRAARLSRDSNKNKRFS